LVLIEGNPLDNISDIRNTVLVIRKNDLYDVAKLYGALSIKPYTDK